MNHALRTLGRVILLALPLTLALPAFAENAPPPQKNQVMPRMAHHRAGRGGFLGYGCHMLMSPDAQEQGMMGKQQGMMGQRQGMMDPGQGTWMQDMLKTSPQDSNEMAELKQEILTQHERLMADRTQMRADCQHMHELFLRMKELRPRHKQGPKTPTTKGNAAPVNPAMDNKGN